jgi:glyoxylase-like metal-dependent hydrolase (beta-lactamase superfamily II)
MIRSSMFDMRSGPHEDVQRWSERVTVVRGLNPGPFTGPGTNTYIVGTGRDRVLIDTGAGVAGYTRLLEEALAAVGARIGRIVLTHGHADHIGGLASIRRELCDAPAAKLPWPDRDAGGLSELADGAEIHVEGATLRALHCPGHAPDHLCFLLEEDGVLFTGDVVLGAGTTVIPSDGGDLALYMRSLERIAALPLAQIHPGHGPRIDDPHARVQGYIEHRQARERQIIDALRAGASTVAEIVAHVYTDTPRALHRAAAQSVLSHLRKLQAEERVGARLDAGGEAHWSPCE